MNTRSHFGTKVATFIGKLMLAALAVAAAGVSVPAQASVSVSQEPLIVQQTLPPDIVLMLDDSGSMDWDYMPDWGYLNNTGNNDALRDAANNQVYYDPTVTYTAPPKADGSYYSNSPGLTNAYNDGFSDTSGVDITRYSGNFPYYVKISTVTSTYAPSCGSGWTLVTSGSHKGQCSQSSWFGTYYQSPTSCNSGDHYDSSSGLCQVTTSSYFFSYSTGSSSGPYTEHYVGTTGSCASLSSANQAVCDDSTATQQNVANWFSYYRTRILMAKSGLMAAFVSLNPSYRIGFGSINNNNYKGITGLGSSNYTTKNSDYIANVQPFGDGSSATQKASFWKWIVGESANNSTPLRVALDAVGQYYKTDQPWSTLSSDPDYDANKNTELACRQAYTILTTDGFWNGNFSSGTPGNADGSNGSTITDPNGQSYKYTAADPYKDSYSNTLADVAMKYWETDLRTSTDNYVPTSNEDPAFWQHMVTFTMGLGFTPTGISPTGTTIDQIFAWADGGTSITGFSWPKPASDSINNIADLAHAAVNGHGGFYSATSPQAFASGLRSALNQAIERNGTGASLAANSTQLQTGAYAYQAFYHTAVWTGDLKAYKVNTDGSIASSSTWSAVTALDSLKSTSGGISTYTSRKIYTSNLASTPAMVAFSDPTVLSSGEQAALGSSATERQNMINYLRGDSTLEQANSGGTYRTRSTPFGDIVDSQPVYVGPPGSDEFSGETFTGSSSFGTFVSLQSSVTPLVWVAANDGMLHGLNASTGAEAFAYIPGAVIVGGSDGQPLKTLADPDYGQNDVPHQYFNDGELTVADAYNTSDSSWHTVLVGTTGRGLARAVYALDVTNPSNIKFLWEHSAGDGGTDSKYMGQMTGKPIVAQVADGSWAVLLGNGYNSSAGVSALLQFDLFSGSLSVHLTTDATADNGLAAPGVWLGTLSNGISTVAYAGDLHGEVWSFQLNDGTSSTPTSTGSLIYTAKDGSNNVQPITSGMLMGKDPSTANVWIFFGTGKYLSSTDLTDVSTQTWYGLIVQSNTSANPAITSGKSRSNLAERKITAETEPNAKATPPTLGTRTVTAKPGSSDMNTKSGWYMDLLQPSTSGSTTTYSQQGERMVTPNQFQSSLLVGTTRIPQASDACNPSGKGWVMALDPFTGTNPTSETFIGYGNVAGLGFSSVPNNPIFVGNSMLVSFDNGTSSSIQTAKGLGGLLRGAWRELINP
jgi:type IV pilus assembly protein PilY1